MASELSILVLYGLLTVVVMLLHVLTATGQVGLAYLATPRDEKRELTGIAGRGFRCLQNSIVAMALFAPAVLVLAVKDAFSGIPWLRTLIWMVGFLATAWLYLQAM